MSRTLYYERIHEWDRLCERVSDSVQVSVRSWNEDEMTPDIVIHCQVRVDGERILDSREAYSHADGDAHFIRLGIAKFDELLAAHPNLSQEAHG